jgi:predicted transcriptional regulator
VARKQVIVQLDEDLVRELDEEATSSGLSRSEVLRRAARGYLNAAEERQIEREYEDAYRRIPAGTEWKDDIAEWDPRRPVEPKEGGPETG